jgi:hypothetical protein
MEDYCRNMMGNYDGSTGYGGMMGPGMMRGWYGPGYGSGGMMGPGYDANNGTTGWRAPTPNANAGASNGGNSIFSRFWNGLTGRGNGSTGGGMMGGGFGGSMMGGR